MIQVYFLFGASFVFFVLGVVFVLRGRYLNEEILDDAVPIESIDEIESIRSQNRESMVIAHEKKLFASQTFAAATESNPAIEEGTPQQEDVVGLEEKLDLSVFKAPQSSAPVSQETEKREKEQTVEESVKEESTHQVQMNDDCLDPSEKPQKEMIVERQRIQTPKKQPSELSQESVTQQEEEAPSVDARATMNASADIPAKKQVYNDDEMRMLKQENTELREALKKELISKDSEAISEERRQEMEEQKKQLSVMQKRVEELSEANFKLQDLNDALSAFKLAVEKEAKEREKAEPNIGAAVIKNGKPDNIVSEQQSANVVSALKKAKTVILKLREENLSLGDEVNDLKLHFRKIKELNAHLIEKDKILQYELTKSRAEVVGLRKQATQSRLAQSSRLEKEENANEC